MSEVQDLRYLAEAKFDSLEREFNARREREVEKEAAHLEETRVQQLSIVYRKLDAPDSTKDHEFACNMRRTEHTGDWILGDTVFQEWAELETLSSKRLYLSGIPGAGK